MSGTVKTYDPARVVPTFAGRLISGFAEGTFIKVARNGDTFTVHVGSDGEVARSRSRNKSGQVEFTLMQGAASNDMLSAQLALDELAGTGAGAFQLQDFNGTTLLIAPAAWVKKLADAEYGNEAGNRVWVLELGQLEGTVGGITAA